MNKYDSIGIILGILGFFVTSYFVLNEIEGGFFTGMPLIMIGGTISMFFGKWK